MSSIVGGGGMKPGGEHGDACGDLARQHRKSTAGSGQLSLEAQSPPKGVVRGRWLCWRRRSAKEARRGVVSRRYSSVAVEGAPSSRIDIRARARAENNGGGIFYLLATL